MDGRCNLNLTVNGYRQTTLVKLCKREALCHLQVFVLLHDTVIIGVLVEPLLVNKAYSLVDQNVSILGFVATLVLQDLLHGGVVRILIHLGLPIFVFSSKAFSRDLLGIEVDHLSVIEFIPVTIGILVLFSILYK